MLSCCIWGSLPAKATRKTSKQVPVACGIDPGQKVGLQVLVSSIGVSLCSDTIPFGGSSWRVNSCGAFVQVVCGPRVLFCLVCALHFADHGMQKWFMC